MTPLMGKIFQNIGSIVQISPVEGASCKFKGPCTECMTKTFVKPMHCSRVTRHLTLGSLWVYFIFLPVERALIKTRHMTGIHMFIILYKVQGFVVILWSNEVLIAKDVNMLCGLLWIFQRLIYFSNVGLQDSNKSRPHVGGPNEASYKKKPVIVSIPYISNNNLQLWPIY